MTRILHFTFGPVQDFIADARRTRDFWAGSFILSLLSAHAMKAVIDAGGTIIFPEVEGDALLKALNGTGAPYVGSLPTRFKADVSGIEKPGEKCKQAITKAWSAIADDVRDYAVKDHVHLSADGVKPNTKAACEIWKRQVNDFWDISFVVGDDPGDGTDGGWLDLRKNWRSHNIGAAEGGDHCRMMGAFQEISGFHRIGKKDQQANFWEKIRTARGGSLDLQEDERLCAIALIKRFFPVVVQEKGSIEGALNFVPGEGVFNIRHWPSTSYIAALPWLAAAQSKLNNEAQSVLWESCSAEFGSSFMGELETRKLYNFPSNGLFRLDGHLLHKDGIKAFVKERVKSGDLPTEKQVDSVKTIAKALTGTAKAIGGDKPRYASEFYAVLRMDGDSIGARLGNPSDMRVIKRALADFTRSVETVFKPGNSFLGTLIYAGGDDVLALLPVDSAIAAAQCVRAEYDAAFEQDRPGQNDFTLSGSIVYSHFKNPLSAVLRQSAHYLDDIAKEKNGRNSLGLAVLKPGGVAADWVTLFDISNDPISTMDCLARAKLGATGKAGLSGVFFHGFRQRYAGLFTDAERAASDDFDSETVLMPLLMHEIGQQFSGKKPSLDELKDIATQAKSILRPQKRGPNGPESQPGVAFDGGMVARFLSAEGRYGLTDRKEDG